MKKRKYSSTERKTTRVTLHKNEIRVYQLKKGRGRLLNKETDMNSVLYRSPPYLKTTGTGG